MISHSKQTRLFLRRVLSGVIVLAIFATTVLTPLSVRAQEDCSEGQLRNLGVAVVNCAGNTQECRVPTSGSPSLQNRTKGGSIYVLGDSLTEGMRDAGNLDAKLRAQNPAWEPTKINGVGGRDLRWGTEQVRVDSALIGTSSSMLIGLGTNNIGDVVRGDTPQQDGKTTVKGLMDQLVTAVRSVNPNIQLYWTSIYVTGTLTTSYGTFDLDVATPIINEALNEVAAANNIGIIPWGTSEEAKNLLSSDGIHPSGKYPEMADYVVGQLSGTGSQVPNLATNCVCTPGSGSLVGSDNREKVFNYFVGKGYTPQQSAGIVGNMMHESGVEPMRLQGTRPGVETPSSTLGGNLTAGIGWGLVQWTPPGKMVTPSLANGDTNDTIDTMEHQLDVLWKQLEGTGEGGLAAINEKSAGDKLKTADTPEVAAFMFGRWYERFLNSWDYDTYEAYKTAADSGGNSVTRQFDERAESARSIFTVYGGGSGVPQTGSTTGYCSTGGVAGPNGWDLPGEGLNPMRYFSQLREASAPEDAAVQGYYGDFPYGEGTIAGCGCGPTSWAMIVSTLTGRTVLPPEVATWAHNNGYRSGDDACSGSAWWWIGSAQSSEQEWGVRAREITIDEAPDYLRQGALIMTSVGPGSVLLSPGGDGHLLVMRAITADGKFLFADPSDSRSKRNAYDEIGDLGSSRAPLDAATVSNGLKGLFVVERL
jgi:lysophospholipase L1-like esterase